MTTQVGHYGSADIDYLIEHDGTVLAEVQSASFDLDFGIEAAGAGLGQQRNTYIKIVDPAKGTWKMDRRQLARTDKGSLFLDLAAGSAYIITEAIAASSATYTPALATTLISILAIRNTTNYAVLREGVDYTVAYSTGIITFAVTTPTACQIIYVSSSRYLKQFMINTSFEDAITSMWTATAGTVARNPSNAQTGSYALAFTANAANDGIRYSIPMTLQPGRTYRLRLYAKAAAAEVLSPYYNDGSVDTIMTVVSGATLTTTYTPAEFTFTPSVAIVPSILIKNTKSSPAVLYIDNIVLLDDTTGNTPALGNNPMNNGLAATPFLFNIVLRRKADGVVVRKYMNCALDKHGEKSGKAYDESLSGIFLDLIRE